MNKKKINPIKGDLVKGQLKKVNDVRNRALTKKQGKVKK